MKALLVAMMFTYAVTGALAQAQRPPSKVILEYRDASMTDTQLAELVRVLAAEVDVKAWPEVVVRKDESDIRRLLDRYYDIESDPAAADSISETVRELTALIEHANKVSASSLPIGQTLKVPPLPVLSRLATATDTSRRLVDPGSQKYAVIEDGGDVRAAFTRQPDQSAAVIKEARRSEVTAISVSVEAAQLVAGADPSAPADAVRVIVPPNHVRVDLLQLAKCPSMDDALKQSPYLDRARARLRSSRDRIVEQAALNKLRLIDFDFNGGHGALVQSAALWLLDRLDVLDALEPFVIPFDLNPSAHVSQTAPIPTPLFVSTNAYWAWGRTRGVLESGARDVSFWLMEQRPTVNGAVYTVPPVLLQSAIWEALDQHQWVSLSWRVVADTGALPVELDSLVQGSGAFVAVAAGNEAREITSGVTPQSAAADSPYFVNVTYGAANGAIFGSFSKTNGGRVDIVANSCGFDTFRALTEKTTGSSLATPLVAAAAWLKHLLDGTSADRMRDQLAHASLLIPAMRRKIVSGGIFDPARLLAGVGAHYLSPDRKTLTEITVEKLDAGGCGTFEPDPDHPQDFTLTTNDSGQYQLIRRHEVDDELRVEPPCTVTTLSLRAVTADGTPVDAPSPEKFEKIIGLLTF